MTAISKITIYLKNCNKTAEKVHQVAISLPMDTKHPFKRWERPRWSAQRAFSLPKRLLAKMQTKMQSFFFQRFKNIAENRKTMEVKFKTVVAILLIQQELNDYFLASWEQRPIFFEALQKAALDIGYQTFTAPSLNLSAQQTARKLTELPFNGTNLMEDKQERELQIALLTDHERDAILTAILHNIKRPPITSVLQVDENAKIQMTTCYAAFNIHSIEESGEVNFSAQHDETAHSSGVINQRIAFDTSGTPINIGSYSGALASPTHLLEQILFILGVQQQDSVELLKTAPYFVEKHILFSSLFSWNELEHIQKENESVDALHHMYLKIGKDTIFKLCLYHQNIPLNSWNKFPIPAEIKATLKDLNDKAFISLSALLDPRFKELATALDKARKEGDFFTKQRKILDLIDVFQLLKSKYPMQSTLAILQNKKLSGIDTLIYTTLFAQQAKIVHHKNCASKQERSFCASAVDKALCAFYKIQGTNFSPHASNEQELSLFKVLYSMYLIWEEPHLNAALSTGSTDEKTASCLLKNPEIAHYFSS